jgi:hypothetical protein
VSKSTITGLHICEMLQTDVAFDTSIFLGKFRAGASNYDMIFPSKSFPHHYSLTVLTLRTRSLTHTHTRVYIYIYIYIYIHTHTHMVAQVLLSG